MSALAVRSWGLRRGLVAIVLPGLVFLAWVAVMGQWSRVRELLLSPAPLVFLAVCSPWFVLVERANPGFSHFFFVREHFMRYAVPDSGEWLTVRTVVDDPRYLVQPFMVSTNFRKEADGASKWAPKACRE